jgi:hypothetical protein
VQVGGRRGPYATSPPRLPRDLQFCLRDRFARPRCDLRGSKGVAPPPWKSPRFGSRLALLLLGSQREGPRIILRKGASMRIAGRYVRQGITMRFTGRYVRQGITGAVAPAVWYQSGHRLPVETSLTGVIRAPGEPTSWEDSPTRRAAIRVALFTNFSGVNDR